MLSYVDVHFTNYVLKIGERKKDLISQFPFPFIMYRRLKHQTKTKPHYIVFGSFPVFETVD